MSTYHKSRSQDSEIDLCPQRFQSSPDTLHDCIRLYSFVYCFLKLHQTPHDQSSSSSELQGKQEIWHGSGTHQHGFTMFLTNSRLSSWIPRMWTLAWTRSRNIWERFVFLTKIVPRRYGDPVFLWPHRQSLDYISLWSLSSSFSILCSFPDRLWIMNICSSSFVSQILNMSHMHDGDRPKTT